MKNIAITDNFSMNRFLMLAKREITTNKRLFIMELAVIVGLTLLAEVFIAWAAGPNYNDLHPSKGQIYYSDRNSAFMIALIGCVGFSILLNVAASLVCSGLSNKKGRITNLMTVGTPAEKYLVNFLIYDVFFIIFFLAQWMAIDYLRVLYINLRYPIDGISVLSLLAEMDWRVILVVIASLAFFQAFYTLVSAFSPKWAFLKGFGLSYAINLLSIPYCMFFSFLYFDVYPSPTYAVIIGAVMAFCFAIAMHLLAYFRYTETDII